MRPRMPVLSTGQPQPGARNATGGPVASRGLSSPIRTVTVGSGLSPDLLDPATATRRLRRRALAGSPHSREILTYERLSHLRDTAGREFHPALRTSALVLAMPFVAEGPDNGRSARLSGQAPPSAGSARRTAIASAYSLSAIHKRRPALPADLRERQVPAPANRTAVTIRA